METAIETTPVEPTERSKGLLHELAMRQKLSYPKYSSSEVSPGGGFTAVVVLDGKEYKSTCVCTKKKDAEQNAAQVALNTLNASVPITKPSTTTTHNGKFILLMLFVSFLRTIEE